MNLVSLIFMNHKLIILSFSLFWIFQLKKQNLLKKRKINDIESNKTSIYNAVLGLVFWFKFLLSLIDRFV